MVRPKYILGYLLVLIKSVSQSSPLYSNRRNFVITLGCHLPL